MATGAPKELPLITKKRRNVFTSNTTITFTNRKRPTRCGPDTAQRRWFQTRIRKTHQVRLFTYVYD